MAEAAQPDNALRHYSQLQLPAGDIWVFGYGSLMWDPGIPFLRRAPALVFGYHRALCVYSSRWRGTPEQPGLVLGLDRGGACRGIVYRIHAADVPPVLEALWEREREMPRSVYEPRLLPARLPGQRARALAFVPDRRHPGYAGKLSVAATARLVATCGGDRGPNVEYVKRTVEHLSVLGVRDRSLQRILDAARRLKAPAGRLRPR